MIVAALVNGFGYPSTSANCGSLPSGVSLAGSVSSTNTPVADVVKEMIFVGDIEAFRDALPIRADFYQGAAPPAATWIEVSRFMRPDFVIEIEVTAELATR